MTASAALPRLFVVAAVFMVGVIGVVGAAAASPAAPGDRWGFSQGLRPLAVEAADGGSLSARGCAACHRQVFDDWQSTRHAAAFSNPVFLDGFAREPQARCIHCHAPLLEQRRELGPLRVPASPPSSSGLLHEGVTCAACHVRGGRVLTTRAVRPADGGPMHDIVVEPGLRDPAFCGSCHQFGFSGPHAAGGGLMQGTLDEWQRYADGGGAGTCQSCHMPGGRHLFRGAWDHGLLERSLRAEVRVDGGGATTLSLSSVEVGHSFPTGDLFRHLTVEARVDDAWRDVARIGRTFSWIGTRKVLAEDTSLQPGQARAVVLPRASTAWRVRYHYAEARHEAAGVVAPVVIAGGELR